MTNRAHHGARSSLALVVLLTGLGAGLSLSACAPSAPSDPTWADDVRPLMVSRCIRCHDADAATGVGRVDPLSAATGVPLLKAPAIPNFNYVNVGDIPSGILTLIQQSAAYARGQGKLPVGPMPPPPAAKLADWQIEMLDTWGKNPPQ